MPSRRRHSASDISRTLFDDEPDTVQTNGITKAAAARAVRRINPPHRKTGGASSVVMTCVLIILAIAGGYAGYLYRSSAAIRNYLVPIVTHSSVASAFPGVATMNLMVIGRDYDYDNNDQILKTHARSDMLMVAHIDFNAGTVQLLSIPRDTEAVIPGHATTKINAAHAFGGPALTAETIKDNFGIPVDHYVALDFDGFKQAIDLLGGVDCTVDKRMDYDDNWGHLHIHLMPGYQHLDGEQAMDFVRFRHSDSDLVRIQRQQALLTQLKQKMVEPATLAILPTLLDTIDAHVSSDMNNTQKIALAGFLHSLPQQSVTMVTLPSNTDGDLVETDTAKASPMVKQIFGVDMPAPLVAATDRAPRRHTREHHRHIALT
jgi:LCP family protein required for cell wall assembly